ncbi:MAG: LysM peptidoglycan-binding domain-containing protein [Anaerolineae bacterium]|uniref:LysM peptidoglycan-binding domain-containing protein n=1 Tax=Candidatus Flexifilum breve TaxID=3140694 RepID=UPI001AD5E22E|nr:LysM peptidoglycan-binding domain-containing protein [Chloroflexota bacterium]MBK9747833.1 LysM peptidoglycan-binding domain-containing protein [Chloroflexota bacterium]MBN8634793.1 LysM peptidoglycan-binding domain-containing protein [Anaerolineae bacterium]
MHIQRLLNYVLIGVFCLLFLVAAPADSAPVDQGLTCDDLVTLATTTVGLACDGIGRNQACYGNTLVNVEFNENADFAFSRSGDVVDLGQLRRISTTPYDPATGSWGVAVVKAQVNLPDTLPGENVTFLLFGDTTLDALSPTLNAVRLRTNVAGTTCDSAPSGMLVQSPTGQQVTININGADVTLGSTALFVAEPMGSMKMAVVEGLGVVEAFGETRIVPQGGEIGVRLGGGDDGLEITGPPSGLRPYTIGVNTAPINMLERPFEIAPALDITPAGTAMSVGTLTATPEGGGPTPTPNGTCTPRADWAARYSIQPGDTLSGIAGRAGLSTNDLAAGNCIVDARRIVVGQVLNVPFRLATNTPTRPPATPTFTPTVMQGMIGPNLRADTLIVQYSQCTNIYWDLENIREVYFEGVGVVGHGSQQVCPYSQTTYQLLVVQLDGTQVPFYITIDVDFSTS